jgi:hypothetical protein
LSGATEAMNEANHNGYDDGHDSSFHDLSLSRERTRGHVERRANLRTEARPRH